MKRAFWVGEDVVVRDETAPVVGAGQILVRVEACGICGTDLHAPTGAASSPMTGHEVAGTIQAIGPGVTGLEVGQAVVLDSATPCGRCEACRNARQELCTDIQSFFYLNAFGFAKLMLAPAICAISRGDLTPDVACLQEPLGVAIDLVRLAELNPASNVLILGQGPIGLMATALARRAGVRRLFATELGTRVRRVELAAQFGADIVLDPREQPIEHYDFGCPIDRVLVTAPPVVLPGAFQAAAKGAIVSFIGIGHGAGAQCTFDANAFHFKKLQLRASFASPALYGPLALQYLREGGVDGAAMVTHCFPLDRIAEAVDTARHDPAAVKVVVHPQE